MKPRVFICHSKRDRNSARYRELLFALQQAGLRVWSAAKSLPTGARIETSLQAAIQECVACVFLQTKSSVKTKWCAAELGAFWGAAKPVLVLAAKGTRVASLAPQLQGYKTTQTIPEVVEQLREIVAAGADDARKPVGTLPKGEFIEELFDRLGTAIDPLEEGLRKMRERLTGLDPFREDSVFGMRYKHFRPEKWEIAKLFIEELGRRIESMVEATSGPRRIRLILDAGTTVFPIFNLLMKRKTDAAWTSTLEIVTNNIPGILIALRDGRVDDLDTHSDLAYRVRVVGGEPTAAYWALLPRDAKAEMGRILETDVAPGRRPLTIGVTTGNYAQDDGAALFVRSPGHFAFKTALMDQADVVYSLLPLGKMLPRRAATLNKRLVADALRDDPEHSYAQLPIPIEGKEVVIVTTQRRQGDGMYRHWTRVEDKLADLEKRHSQVRTRYVAKEDFTVSSLLQGGGEEREKEIEIPHEPHRAVLEQWFGWSKT